MHTNGAATLPAIKTGAASHWIPEIRPEQVYTIKTLTATLGLCPSTLPRELRLKRMRYAKRAGRAFILGEWVIEWLRGGEVHRNGQS